MSMAKRLAEYYSKDEATADAVTGLLKKFGLTAVAPRLAAHVRARVRHQEQYTTVYIRSAVALNDAACNELLLAVGAPKGTPVVVTIDPSVLQGAEVSYGGRKWSSNAKEKLNRFVTSK